MRSYRSPIKTRTRTHTVRFLLQATPSSGYLPQAFRCLTTHTPSMPHCLTFHRPQASLLRLYHTSPDWFQRLESRRIRSGPRKVDEWRKYRKGCWKDPSLVVSLHATIVECCWASFRICTGRKSSTTKHKLES